MLLWLPSSYIVIDDNQFLEYLQYISYQLGLLQLQVLRILSDDISSRLRVTAFQ